MTTAIVVAAVVVILVAVVVVTRRRRPTPTASIRRDAPTVGTVAPRRRIGTRLGGVFRRAIDDDFWDWLEEALIGADVGLAAATEIVAAARRSEPATPDGARRAVRDAILAGFEDVDRSVGRAGDPAVVVVVGVNGSGKTTTIAKLAADAIAAGESVLVGAADTFRAAAAEQLIEWGERVGFEVVRGGEGADPASVAFDARSAAAARGADLVIVDTAGRLHSERNLMDELSKIVRVLGNAGPVSEVLLVLDGSIGQNGIAQARAFTDAVGVTGTVVTKLDGTARGGVAIAVERELGIPLKLIGVGEGPHDLLHFEPAAFVDQLLGE